MGSPPPPPPPLLFFKQSPISHSRDETSRTKLGKKHKYEKLEFVLMRHKNTNSQRETDTKAGSTLCNKEMKNQQNQNCVISFLPFVPESHSQEKKKKKEKLISLLDSIDKQQQQTNKRKN
jgi:hypothetical protein